ncbi:hypothetical protein MUO93_07255 [Candidatus Bathyarchaeota archaeon]|nr:hypothetical protein [Candidatus Bathyarchaeota archaeon]
MFIVVYHYKIPIKKTRDYVQLEKQAIKIYLECGCSGVEIYRDASYPARWMEINRFEDREHYPRVIGVVSRTPGCGSYSRSSSPSSAPRGARPRRGSTTG